MEEFEKLGVTLAGTAVDCTVAVPLEAERRARTCLPWRWQSWADARMKTPDPASLSINQINRRNLYSAPPPQNMDGGA